MPTTYDVFDLDDYGDRYRAQLLPELYPDERQPVLDNWPDEDREVFEPKRSKERTNPCATGCSTSGSPSACSSPSP
jgi:hypothetical protein